MHGEKHWYCSYDSTWEGEEEEEDEPAEERPKSQERGWIVSWIGAFFPFACLLKLLNWIQWRWLIFTGKKNEGKNTYVKKNQQRPNEGTFRQRNMRAAQDMQNYRHGYPELEDEDEDSTDMPNLRFYLNEDRFQPNGVLIEDLLTKWHKNYKILEQSHSYIQWLFPLREPGVNWSATPLSKKELEAFKESAEVKERFVRAYKLMLDFYGIDLVDEQTGKLMRAQHYELCFQNLNWHSHNNLRITRILKCLGEMGYEHFQVKLVKYFLKETLKKRMLQSVKQSALDYFLFTVRDRNERRKLVHYAWKHFQPQDRFVWGPHEKLKRFKEHRKLPKQSNLNSAVVQATVTEAEAGNTGLEGGLEQTFVEVVDETASPNTSPLKDRLEGEVSDKESILKGSEDAASEEEQETPSPRQTENPESSEVPEVRTTAEAEVARNPIVGEAVHQDAGAVQPPMVSYAEALKEGKKRKLPGMQQEGATENVQRSSVHETSPTKHPLESEKLKMDSLNTESNQAKSKDDSPLPASKKKKVDEPEREYLRLGEESSQNKSPTDDGNGLFQPPVSKTNSDEREIHDPPQFVEEKSLSINSNNSSSLPKEPHDIKDDFSENRQRIPNSTDESKVEETCDCQHVASMPPQGKTQENNTKTQDLEKVKEGHNEVETEQTRNVTAVTLADEVMHDNGLLGETQVDNQGKVLGVCVENTEEELARQSDILGREPKTMCIVCPTPPLEPLISQRGSPPLNGEQDPKLGSSEQTEQKEHCDIPAPHNDTDEQRKTGNDGNEEQVQHGKSLMEQQDSNTIRSIIDMMETRDVMETKDMSQLGNSKLAEATNEVEEIKGVTEHEGSQTTEASVEEKQVFRTTQVPDAVKENASQVEKVDSKLAQTAVVVKEYKGLTEQESPKSAQTAQIADKANGLMGHQDCQPQQDADVLGEPNEAAGLPAQADC